MLQGLVANLLKEQGINTKVMVDDSQVDISAVSPQEAKDLTDDDGYFGVDKTSDRIFQFAIGLAGGDPSRIDAIKEGVDKGYRPSFVSFPDIPQRPPSLCPGCPHRGVFVVLKKLKATVFGDIGCYTLGALPPLSSLHSCVCMGAGIGMVHGADKAGDKGKKVAVIGDSTFYHSGITGLADIVYNGGTSTVVILDNGTTAMTGKQGHPGTGATLQGQGRRINLETLLKGLGMDRVRVVDPYDLKTMEEVLREEMEVQEPSVVVTRRPCTLITSGPLGSYGVDEDLCIGCGLCVRVGCIALAMVGEGEDRKARIESHLCYGCGVCAQVCPKGAIGEAGDG